MVKHKANKSSARLYAFLIIGVLILAGISFAIYHHYHNNTAKKVMQTASLPDSNIPIYQRPVTPTNDVPGGSTGSNAVNNKEQILQAPYGTFVSNHYPNLGGSPAPNTIESVCTTSLGASCAIDFTKDGETKSLGIKAVDDKGSAYWTWKLQDIGLTEGSWQIIARATLNGQTKTSADPKMLQVSP